MKSRIVAIMALASALSGCETSDAEVFNSLVNGVAAMQRADQARGQIVTYRPAQTQQRPGLLAGTYAPSVYTTPPSSYQTSASSNSSSSNGYNSSTATSYSGGDGGDGSYDCGDGTGRRYIPGVSQGRC